MLFRSLELFNALSLICITVSHILHSFDSDQCNFIMFSVNLLLHYVSSGIALFQQKNNDLHIFLRFIKCTEYDHMRQCYGLCIVGETKKPLARAISMTA